MASQAICFGALVEGVVSSKETRLKGTLLQCIDRIPGISQELIFPEICHLSVLSKAPQ